MAFSEVISRCLLQPLQPFRIRAHSRVVPRSEVRRLPSRFLPNLCETTHCALFQGQPLLISRRFSLCGLEPRSDLYGSLGSGAALFSESLWQA